MITEINSFDEIKSYVYIELAGSDDPDEAYFEIPLNDKELINIIDDTLREYFKWGYKGVKEGYYVLETVAGQQSYTIPDQIYALPYQIQISSPETNGSTTVDYTDFVRSGVFYLGGNHVYGADLDSNFMSYYVQHNVQINDIRRWFKPQGQYRFDWHTHTLFLMHPPSENGIKIFYAFYNEMLKDEAPYNDHTVIDFQEYFNEPLMRQLLIAKCKKKIGWSQKYIKTLGLSNYTIDFDAIYNEGKEDEAKIMDELKGNADLTLINFG
jgi:hypothetical protein